MKKTIIELALAVSLLTVVRGNIDGQEFAFIKGLAAVTLVMVGGAYIKILIKEAE